MFKNVADTWVRTYAWDFVQKVFHSCMRTTW